MDKFEYIDFFVKEEKVNFDKKLINKNILKVLVEKGQFFCLEGKRLITGKIDSWKLYLQRYVYEEKFKDAMIVALKIYHQKMKKLCLINEK